MGLSKALFFHNPKAGRIPLSDDKIDGITRRLREAGFDTTVQLANGYEDSGELDSLAEYDLLIVSGGDGTVHDLLPRIVRTPIPLAILPTGTANVFARDLGVPMKLEEALDVIVSGKRRKMPLGQADELFFHLMAGIGIDGYIIRQVSPSSKKSLGVIAFWIAGIRRFWSYPLKRFGVEVKGKFHEATFAVISNSRFYGGHLKITPKADIFESSLDVCLFKSTSHLYYLKYLWGVLTGRHTQYSDVYYTKADRVKITPYPGLSCQLDGEPLSILPTNIGISEKSIEVIVP